MDRTDVDSSILRSVGYDLEEGVLEIEFKEDRVYQYVGVPERVYDELMSAQSKGTYFTENIRDAYTNRRIK